RWLPDDERPLWRRVMSRFQEGPEDWRLAYVSAAITALMFLTFPVGGVLLLVPAFLLSRAWVALMNERGEPLGARKWLILPSIAFVFLLLVLGALVSVPGMAGAIAVENDLSAYGIPVEPRTTDDGVRFAGYIGVVAGAWWMLLSALAAFLFEPIRTLFAPILDRMKRRQLFLLTAIGAVCLVAGLRLMAIA
ncbi:MAG: hypothetical protein WA208_16315, partial [Thermoanaerobaculia bacterium]